jgi:phosphomethylpyrimidine synthase
MCGHDWCSVRISKEIQEFASGKAPEYAWDKPRKTDALTPGQRAILDQRGVLPPEEIHRLASKVRRAMGGGDGAGNGGRGGNGGDGHAEPEGEQKPSCHSDYVPPEEAARLQRERAGGGRLVRIGG